MPTHNYVMPKIRKPKMKVTAVEDRPVIELPPVGYQPSKAELEEELQVPEHLSSDDVKRLVFQAYNFTRKKTKKKRKVKKPKRRILTPPG